MEKPCEPNPCLNGGECVEENGKAKCICPVGYAGDKCEGMANCVDLFSIPDCFLHIINCVL